jgi:hypothetical protein
MILGNRERGEKGRRGEGEKGRKGEREKGREKNEQGIGNKRSYGEFSTPHHPTSPSPYLPIS